MTDRDEKVREALVEIDELARFWLERDEIHGLDDDCMCATEISFGTLRKCSAVYAALSHPAPDVPGAEETQGTPAQDVEIEHWRSQCESYAAFTMQATDLEPLIWRIDAERAELDKERVSHLKTRAKLDAARAETDSQKRRGDNHWETLQSIRHIARETGDLERIVQWVNDAGSGYTQSNETTVAKLMDELSAARAELDAEQVSHLKTRAKLTEVRKAAGETLDTYAKSFRKMACEEYLVDALTFKGSSDNVKLAYGRAQGIEMARDRLAAARKGT